MIDKYMGRYADKFFVDFDSVDSANLQEYLLNFVDGYLKCYLAQRISLCNTYSVHAGILFLGNLVDYNSRDTIRNKYFRINQSKINKFIEKAICNEGLYAEAVGYIVDLGNGRYVSADGLSYRYVTNCYNYEKSKQFDVLMREEIRLALSVLKAIYGTIKCAEDNGVLVDEANLVSCDHVLMVADGKHVDRYINASVTETKKALLKQVEADNIIVNRLLDEAEVIKCRNNTTLQ